VPNRGVEAARIFVSQSPPRTANSAGWQRRRWKKQQFDWGLTIEYDRRRTAVLEELGIRVIRLWDDDV
jgi:hypothetical protein